MSAAASSHPTVQAPACAAFFDLDKTLIARNSALAFSWQFHRAGLISYRMAWRLSLRQLHFHLQRHSNDSQVRLRYHLSDLVAGWPVAKVRRITAASIPKVIRPAIYPAAREAIAMHQRRGHQVLIVSASAGDLVRPIAKELGVSQVIASELEIRSGRYTGQLVQYIQGPAKATAIKQYAQAHGISLAHSYAYSDSATDIPLLDAVAYPIAVNADRVLRRHARLHNWQLRRWRLSCRRQLMATAGGLVCGAIALTVAKTRGGKLIALARSGTKNTASLSTA